MEAGCLIIGVSAGKNPLATPLKGAWAGDIMKHRKRPGPW